MNKSIIDVLMRLRKTIYNLEMYDFTGLVRTPKLLAKRDVMEVVNEEIRKAKKKEVTGTSSLPSPEEEVM